MSAEATRSIVALTDGRLPTFRYLRADGKIDVRRIAAVVVDVDGVVTDTARVHAEAWKGVLDAFLRTRAKRRNESYRPFDVRHDYLTHLSGRPRPDGIRSFLDSRGITTNRHESDERRAHTVRQLGELKDRYLFAELQRHRVVAYPSTVSFLRTLRDHETRVAAVSSSHIGAAVLRAAGITELFDVAVTGLDGDRPLPMHMLLRLAVSRLDLPSAAIAFISSTPARFEPARHDGFGLVIGVSRNGLASAAFHQRGADLVVTSLADIPVISRSSTTVRGELV